MDTPLVKRAIFLLRRRRAGGKLDASDRNPSSLEAQEFPVCRV